MKKASELQRCIRCTIPETFPNISFNEKGLCEYCQETPDSKDLESERNQLQALMEAEIEKSRGKGEYDCIVAYSGGKDSTYTLMHLTKHYNLNCLAVTIDNDFMSSQAVKNCYIVTEALGVDFLMFKPAPSFMMNMYKTSITTGGVQNQAAIKRVSSVCNSCINLINNYMIKLALLHEAPIVAGGYIGGQVPKNASMLNMNLIQREQLKKPLLEKYNSLFGQGSSKFFFIKDSLISNANRNSVTIINPMLTLSIGEEDIITAIKDLGWIKPQDTGRNSSNCLLNDLGVAIHYKKHKFHAYEFEVAEQVRYGLMDRELGLKKVTEIPDFSELTDQMDKVGLALSEI